MASINPILQAKAGLHNIFMQLARNVVPGTEPIDTLSVVNAGSKNTADIAARFLIAEQARSFWNKAYDNVKKEAKDAGILGEEEDYVEGETVVVSSFTGFDLVAKKAAASEMVTPTALRNALNKFASTRVRDQVLEDCVKEKKGAVTISVSVK